MDRNECVYLGDGLGNGKYKCRIFQECTKTKARRMGPGNACKWCKHKLLLEDDKFSKKWSDNLYITDKEKQVTESLRNLLEGKSAFLIGGGPSANDLPLERLNDRGIWTMTINNVGAHPRFRPNSFVCSDPPLKFHHNIWLDPGIMKFIPTPKLTGNRGILRRKKKDGTFEQLERRTHQMPNVWGFKRISELIPNEFFFLEDGACWGNHKMGADRHKQPKTVCTFLLGIRLLYHLGIRQIYLVGVDFYMTPKLGYSFEQARNEGASANNNRQFANVNGWLCEMMENGTFKKFNLTIYNCYQSSGLRAFPYVPFEDALKEAKMGIDEKPDLAGWYEK